MNKFIVLYGPTGVGKTDIGLGLASVLNVEIVNMDVGQFYVPFSVGTAKPDWRNSEVSHHLFDCINEPVNLSAVTYRKRVIGIMQELWSRGKIPLLIGGSGFYLYSLLFQIGHKEGEETQIFCADCSWQNLERVDKKRSNQIHPNDQYRVSRALQIYYKTTVVASDLAPHFNPIAPCDIIFLSRDRCDLYARINERTNVMFQTGFIEEVQALIGTPWEEFVIKKKLIGYNDLALHLKANNNNIKQDILEVIKQLMARKTRNYAKRQNIFWRYLEKKLMMEQADLVQECKRYVVDLTSNSYDSSIQKIVSYIKNRETL